MTDEIPWDELDPSIVDLVRVLNSFPGIDTIGSCGGHESPVSDEQAPAGLWWVKFTVAQNADGWVSLEFLAWAINRDMERSGSQVVLFPTAPPPWLNHPGQVLSFVMERTATDRDEDESSRVAAWLEKLRDQYYVDSEHAARWEEEEARDGSDPE